MTRIPLLGAKPKTAQFSPAWRDLLTNAACNSDHATLIGLLNVPGARVALRAQFSPSGFAGMCLDRGTIEALRAVLEVAPDGITLRDTCTLHVIEPARWAKPSLELTSEIDLHVLAIAAHPPNPAALASALKYEPASACITEPQQRFHDVTLHRKALEMATRAPTAQSALPAAECCKILLAHGAPIGIAHGAPIGIHSAHLPGSQCALADLLFGTRWDRQGVASPVAPLINAYLNAGLWDLDASLSTGYTPLETAITAGNGHAAAMLLDLGCEHKLPAFPALCNDLLALSDEFARQDGTNTCRPLIAEALMRQRITQRAPHTPSVPAGAGRSEPRARRHGI